MWVAAMPRAGAVVRRLIANLLLATAASCLTLAFAEVMLRVAGHRILSRGEWLTVGTLYRTPDPPVGFSLEPLATQLTVSGGAYTSRVVINAQGLRDVEHPLRKPAGSPRILILGDSFMFGQGVRMEESMPRQVAGLLPGVEVINGGVPGYDLGQEYLYYKDRGYRFEPDLVLLAFFINDLAHSREITVSYEPSGLPASFQRNSEMVKREQQEAPLGLKGAVSSWMRTHSALYVFCSKRLDGIAARRKRSAKPLEDKEAELPYLGAFSIDARSEARVEWERAYDTLDELRRLVLLNHSRFTVVLVPAPFQTSEKAWSMWMASWRTPATSVSRRQPQEMVLAWCRRTGTPCLDLLPDFEKANNDQLYFPYDGHWTPQGHRLAALSVSAFLSERGLR